MALLGPMVVVAENSAADVIGGLDKAGAFPIVEASYADAAQAIADVLPAAVVLAEPAPACDTHHVQALIRKIEARGGPFMPVLARIADADEVVIPSALPVALDESIDRLIARLRSALRVRSLHATVLRRCAAANSQSAGVRTPALSRLLDDATVLCVGRGRSYPALTTAIGERVSLIGAMSVETAARYLNARDIDGVVIGDGFGPRVVEALLEGTAPPLEAIQQQTTLKFQTPQAPEEFEYTRDRRNVFDGEDMDTSQMRIGKKRFFVSLCLIYTV